MEKLDLINNITERIIMEISPKCSFAVKIMNDLNITYSHTIKIIRLLERNKLIKKEKSGRKMYIELTKKGLLIQKKLREIKLLI